MIRRFQMQKLFNYLPENWLFKVIVSTLVTTLTFYLFQWTDEFQFFSDFWKVDEKFYIYTFLGIQIVLNGLFYVVLFHLLKKLLFQKIKKKILNELNVKKSISDLKFLSEIKKVLVRIFGFQILIGNLDKCDILKPLEITEFELDELMEDLIKWICLFCNFGVVSLLVWHLSAWYIVPFLIFIIGVIFLFWYVVTFLFANVVLIEKVRIGIVASTDKINPPQI